MVDFVIVYEFAIAISSKYVILQGKAIMLNKFMLKIFKLPNFAIQYRKMRVFRKPMTYSI